jgi:uncharacterized FlgJ-related protein
MTPQQTDAASRIYQQCIAGSDKNPGLPEALCKLIVGQSGNETAGWTSNFFIHNNNCFGYECSSASDYQNGCSAGNADNGVQVGNYDTIEDSTKEIIDWIYRRVADGKFPSDLGSITSADQYAQLLKNAGYYGAPESSYAANIKAWVSRIGNLFQRH